MEGEIRKQVIVLANIISPRLQYISDFIGREIDGAPLLLTNDVEVYKKHDGPRINYTGRPTEKDEFLIQPHSLLEETDIKLQQTSCFEFKGYKAFFYTAGDFPFDIFAASFYLLSRYEEYLPHDKDMYGRYAHENSLAYKENFLNLPLVNLWLQEFKAALVQKLPDFNFQPSTFNFQPTYDIDIAYSYKHKGFQRTAGGLVKSLLTGQWSSAAQRLAVLSGSKEDPFDAYVWMDRMHEQYELKPYYFFHVGESQAGYDKNISPRSKAMQRLIQHCYYRYPVGIHPSWRSGDDPSLLRSEMQTLSTITGGKVTASRQHYIRFSLPDTFRRLMEAGIRFDFSMGYGSINGFRASVATPFFWYDLEREEATTLQLFPFCFMDANSFYEQHFTAQQALDEMRHYYTVTKGVNGLLIMIWHNNFLGFDPVFSEWKDVYEQFLRETSYS
jgi:hypothetical protein